MPEIAERTNEVVQSIAMNESPESSSLQVSSSAPDVLLGRGLHVQAISSVPGGTESSVSSQTTLSPTHPGMPRRNRSRDGPYDASVRVQSRHSRSPSGSHTGSSQPSHRGPGSVAMPGAGTRSGIGSGLPTGL